jgi:hypothetical protein
MKPGVYSKSFEMCGKKRGYKSDILAAVNAGIQQAKFPGTRLRVYRCPLCRMWHLTHHESREVVQK